MAKTYDRTLAWTVIEPATLAPELQRAYEAYKAQYRKMKEARDLFERQMNTLAPVGQVMKFGYNFGKLSVALDVAPAPTAKTVGKGAQNLAAWLEAQATR